MSVRPEDGVPDVSDLPMDIIEQAGQPYMERYFLLRTEARFHHIVQSDLEDLHDHPWDFVSVILTGRYIETTPDTEQEYGPGTVLIRKAEQLHRLTLSDGPVWTFITTSPARRRWGFATADGWRHWSEYLPASRPTSSRQW